MWFEMDKGETSIDEEEVDLVISVVINKDHHHSRRPVCTYQ